MEWGLIMMDIHRIKTVLDYARLWEYDLTVFGSNGHLYCLNAVVDESALTTWETAHGLVIPQDYRDYLTKVGNGFAGPGYGITPFDLGRFAPEWKEPCLHAPEFAGEYDRLAGEIAELIEKDTGDDQEEILYDALYKRFNQDGVLEIGTGGCAGINAIALNGSTKGFYLSLVGELEYYRVGELGTGSKPFAEWFMEWVDKVEQVCSQLTQAQLNRSKWEREWMLEFAQYWQKKDVAEMARLVAEIECQDSVSAKCVGFLFHFSPKNRRHLPGAEGIEYLRERMGKIVDRQKKRQYNLSHIYYPGEAKYNVAWNPTLEDFVEHL